MTLERSGGRVFVKHDAADTDGEGNVLITRESSTHVDAKAGTLLLAANSGCLQV
jgi:hypothetical protein